MYLCSDSLTGSRHTKLLSNNVITSTRLLYIRGTSHWQKWKQRYIVLVKVGQIVFCLCSYKEKQATPNEMLTLEGYTVNYYSPDHQDCEEDAKFQVCFSKVPGLF